MIEEEQCAIYISKMAETEGWQIIFKWIQSRIDALTIKILSGESNVSIGNVVKNKVGTKTEITIINLIKDNDQAEIKTWKLLLDKISKANKG